MSVSSPFNDFAVSTADGRLEFKGKDGKLSVRSNGRQYPIDQIPVILRGRMVWTEIGDDTSVLVQRDTENTNGGEVSLRFQVAHAGLNRADFTVGPEGHITYNGRDNRENSRSRTCHVSAPRPRIETYG